MNVPYKLLLGIVLMLSVSARGEDRALIIGIEGYGAAAIRPALGSERDADAMARFAEEKLGFKPASIRVLKGAEATAGRIAREVQTWLIAGTKPGDRVFLYYSGHGSYLRDNDNDEKLDGYDETIVAHDADRSGRGMIRDDQFSKWIAELSGRRIVMIFDSCHSGTISRGGGSSGAGDPSARYIVPDDSELGETRTRNLVEVSDGKIGDNSSISRQSNAVIISAAGAKQTAHSMAVNGQWRGALTQALLDAYGAGAPRLRELRDAVRQRVRDWQVKKMLNGEQVPEFEITSGLLEEEPLFGQWEQTPQIALANPQSKMKVTLATGAPGRRRDAKGHLVYYEGEEISYQITTDTPGFLYLLAFSREPETGRQYVSMLFPNAGESLDNRIEQKLRLPANSSFTVTATGLDITVALVATRKLPIEIKAEYSWEEMFGALQLKELQEAVYAQTRGIKVEARTLDWQAAALPVFTTKKN